MKKRFWLATAMVLGLALWTAPLSAQPGMGGPKIAYKAVLETDAAHPGAETRAVFTFQLDKGWHVNSNKPLDEFSIPTELTLAETSGYAVEKIVYPKHKVVKLSFSPDDLALYEAEFRIGVVIKIADSVELKTHILKGQLHYQACNDKACAPPNTVELEIPVNVAPKVQALVPQAVEIFKSIAWSAGEEKKPAAEKKTDGTAETDAGQWLTLANAFQETGRLAGYASTQEFLDFIDNAEHGKTASHAFAGKSLWLILLLVLGGGLALNLTPCVLPLIPINIAIIGAGARAGSRGRGFALGGVYGAGIAMVYGLLGLVVVLGLSSAFGSINSTPWFNGAIAVLFVVLALAMFEIINIDFSKYQAKIGLRRNEKGSFAIAFVMGSISALLAGACVAPVVIYTIVYAQDLYAKGSWAALLLPFLLGVGMALPWPFAGAGLSFLPKPGGWMTRVKQLFGLFILAFALYYGHLAYTLFSEQHGVDQKAVEVSVTAEEGWITSLEAGLKQAQAETKPVLLDFWATWCKNCLVMNKTTLKDPAVQERLKDYIKIKYQAEDPKASPVKEVWEHYQLLGLPAYIILQPKTP